MGQGGKTTLWYLRALGAGTVQLGRPICLFKLFTLGKLYQVCLFHIISTPLCLKTAAKRFPPQSALWGPAGRTYIQNRNIHILRAVAPESKRERTPERDGFKVSYWGEGASWDNGFIHRANARQKGSFTSVLVHHCNIYIEKGNYAVRHRGKKKKKKDKSFPPQEISKWVQAQRDSHQLLVKRTRREVMTLKRGSHCRGNGPEPDRTCLLPGHLKQPGFGHQKPSNIRNPTRTPHVLSKTVCIYSGGWEGRLGCPELCLKTELEEGESN